MTTIEKIKKQIEKNSIILYMKGSPNFPKCGFSARAAEILCSCEKRFAYVDVLENLDIKKELPKYSNWPTYPQLWINKKLIGGCDIISDMFTSGELQSIINKI